MVLINYLLAQSPPQQVVSIVELPSQSAPPAKGKGLSHVLDLT